MVTEIKHVQIIPATVGETPQSLQVDMEASDSNNCTRLSQNLLQRVEGGITTYYPLGSSLNGRGFNRNDHDGMAVTNFRMVTPIPPGIPSGTYELVHRSDSTCRWFGGFLSQTVTFESPPVKVRINER